MNGPGQTSAATARSFAASGARTGRGGSSALHVEPAGRRRSWRFATYAGSAWHLAAFRGSARHLATYVGSARPLAIFVAGTAAAGPALALEVEPYVRLGAEAAYESNVTGRYSVAEEPYRSFYAKGQADTLGVGVFDAGFDILLDDRFSLYTGLGAKAIGFASYPTFSYLTGNGIVEASAVDLPGDFDASVAMGYRDDFQGWRGQWASATVERPLAWAIAGYASAGYDRSTALDPRAAREGPFLDLGVRRRFRDTGTSLRAALGASRAAYGSGRFDTVVTASAGVSQRLLRGVYATLRARFDLVDSSEPSRTYSAPAVAIGTAWVLP